MDIEDILEEARIDLVTEGDRHCRSGWAQMECPFCTDRSGKLHLGLNLAGNYWHCWSCGFKRTDETLAALLDIPIAKARSLIKDLDIQDRLPSDIKVRGKLRLPKEIGELEDIHKDYLRERRFNPKKLKRLWKIGGLGPYSEPSWRIFIPIYSRGEIVSWTTRAVGENQSPPYLSASPEQEVYHHKHLLYGEDLVSSTIVVHEGPMDVFATGPGAVCTFGIGITEPQIFRISRYPRRVICLDNEPQAQETAREICDKLEVFDGETINVVLDAKDAGESHKEARQLARLYLGE